MNSARIASWPWACPACGAGLLNLGDVLMCATDHLSFARRQGLVYLLAPGRAEPLASLLPRLVALRREEGGDLAELSDPTALPDLDPENDWAPLWEQRAISWRAARARLGALFGARPLRVLDLGAANCWMSLRLAELGHAVLACDPSPDPGVGLAAADLLVNPAPFERAVCELERLPLAADSIDAVVSSGALHLAHSKSGALAEAARVLRPGGALLVTDSPVVRFREDGQRLARGLAAEIEERHNEAPWVDEPFFVIEELEGAIAECGLSAELVHPRRGWRWRAGSLATTVSGGMAGAEYPLVVAIKG